MPFWVVLVVRFPKPAPTVGVKADELTPPTTNSFAEVVVAVAPEDAVPPTPPADTALSKGAVVSRPEYSLTIAAAVCEAVKLTVTVGVVPPVIFFAYQIETV